MLSPEPPYPLHGGGAFRIASLLHYLGRFSEPDLILLSESGSPALLPPGLVRSQNVIALPHHSRDLFSRYLRNASRAIRGVPPLIDRFSGMEPDLERILAGKRWDLGVVEHFWCAPYVDLLKRYCNRVVLDLHNVESVLHQQCARNSHANFANGFVRAGHRRFAAASRQLESRLLPQFSLVLTASEEDAALLRKIAPAARVLIYPNAYPNAFPLAGPPRPTVKTGNPLVVFSGNFEYHPNIDAVEFLVREIWPEVRRRHPNLRLRLVGRGDQFIRHLIPSDAAGIEVTGPIEDALGEIVQADVVIAPLRIGSGTRLKIIEAWAASRAVIATPLAAEGLAARDGENIRLAPDAPSFAAAIGELLRDPALCQRLGTGGHAAFESRYSWNAAWKTLDLDAQLTTESGLNGYTERT